jgi:hypothetical protein
MKKPVVDYREFRLSRLNEPRFAHLRLLGGELTKMVENTSVLRECVGSPILTMADATSRYP